MLRERERGRMQLLLWFLVWFVWRAMGTITTQQFFAPQNWNMKITSPIRELLVLSELQCAMACKQNSTCLSYSVTRHSGTFTCRFGYRYDELRTADADSKFFYRDVPAGFNLVPGTRRYVKMTVKSIVGYDAATMCKNEGSLLVSSTDDAVHDYTKQLWANRPSGSNFVVGGVSITNQNTWIFPDGFNLVPGTRRYVKMTVKSIVGYDAATMCKNEGSLLVSSTDDAVHDYTKQLWANRPSGSNFVVGGVSITNQNTWIFPDGFNLVPGTRRYVKMTVKSIVGYDAATMCKNEGSLLVSSTDDAVHDYTKQLWANRPSGSNFVVGGVSITNQNTWIFPDDTNLTVTGVGEAGFCSTEPNGGVPGYCLHFWLHDPVPCWADSPCSGNYDGYICEIKVPN
ncbi:unnamed protein product [Darwinula stevensoni]|uniref:C-type lectin domain-containing protein n=1 Tax=Darwinula stevensoni TaxID=69355 RepID=A0A7R8XGH3_9CRUS|nr:unnamed protein product [Darwinula stevensoni]CAG0891681.1 unnamed protein product [Darwinula stevensoni]